MAPWLAVATVCFGAFMGQLDASVVTLAFPALQRHFGVPLAAALVDVPMLAASGIWPLLTSALCAYLVLFGPLVLIPQVLTAHGRSPARHLARLLHMRPNTVTTIVNALTARGMISRATADGDRRAIELTVTDAGQQAVHAWQATNAAVLHLALSTLPESQRRALTAAVPAIEALARAIDRLADTPPADQDPDKEPTTPAVAGIERKPS